MNADFQKNDKISDVEYTILQLQSQINALHKQLNPDWKRKKSLPYHFNVFFQKTY